MSADQPFVAEPGPAPSLARSNLATGVLAFAGGIALTVAVTYFYGGPRPADPVPAVERRAAPGPAATAALPPGTDIATLAAREQALAARLDAIETRLRDVDAGARTASSFASQAERLMIAASVRRAIERGQPLGQLEAQLRRRFAEAHGEAVATVAGAAGRPVTLEDLRLALDTIGPRLAAAPDQGWWPGIRRMLGDLIVLRQAETPSPRPADRLKRAQRVLNEGQVEAALAEVAHMPGVASAESWVGAAKRYIAARAALREIELAAMETPAAAPAGI